MLNKQAKLVRDNCFFFPLSSHLDLVFFCIETVEDSRVAPRRICDIRLSCSHLISCVSDGLVRMRSALLLLAHFCTFPPSCDLYAFGVSSCVYVHCCRFHLNCVPVALSQQSIETRILIATANTSQDKSSVLVFSSRSLELGITIQIHIGIGDSTDAIRRQFNAECSCSSTDEWKKNQWNNNKAAEHPKYTHRGGRERRTTSKSGSLSQRSCKSKTSKKEEIKNLPKARYPNSFFLAIRLCVRFLFCFGRCVGWLLSSS